MFIRQLGHPTLKNPCFPYGKQAFLQHRCFASKDGRDHVLRHLLDVLGPLRRGQGGGSTHLVSTWGWLAGENPGGPRIGPGNPPLKAPWGAPPRRRDHSGTTTTTQRTGRYRRSNTPMGRWPGELLLIRSLLLLLLLSSLLLLFPKQRRHDWGGVLTSLL